jgi:hypothetical protein
MKNIKLLIGFVLMTVFVGCSPRFSFVKADYDGQRRPTQVGYGSSGYGHSNDRDRGYGHSRYGFKGYNYKDRVYRQDKMHP